MIPTKIERQITETGNAIAKDLELIFNGIQYNAQEDPAGLVFTDPDTGSSFMASDALEAQIRLNELRKSFQDDLTDSIPPISC